jgi:hypothetical protein
MVFARYDARQNPEVDAPMLLRPLLNVWTLSSGTRCRRVFARLSSHWFLSCIAGVIALLGLATVISKVSAGALRGPVTWVTHHDELTALAVFMYAIQFVVRRRAHLASEHSQSWLLATPLPPRTFQLASALRIALEVFAHALLAQAVLVAVAIASDQLRASLAMPLLWIVVGWLLGGLVGAVWRLKCRTSDSEHSRFIIDVKTPPSIPSLSGLSHWPIAKALVWHRPEHARFLFIAAALSIPVGASALLGLAILTVWSLGSYLLALARSVPDVAQEAATWLRPTTLPFASFAWAVTRRALLHQIVGVGLLGTVSIVLGAQPASVVHLASMWLLLTIMTSMIGLRQSYLGSSAKGSILLSILVIIAAELRARGSGLFLAAVVSACCARGVNRGHA